MDFKESGINMNESYTQTELDCPANHTEFENSFVFWVDGTALCLIGFPGILLNLTAIFIISRHNTLHNTFNLLLVTLFIFDSTYLVTTLANQSFMKQFNMATKSYIIMYPYFMHPLKHISFTSSIFMTIVIAYERYSSITRPIQNYMGRKRTRLGRVLVYVAIILFTSIIFNIPKFMEAQIEWESLERYISILFL